MRYLIGLLLFSWSLLASAEAVKIPDYTQPVIDQTGTLTKAQIQGLTAKLGALEKEKGAQVAVLVIADTGDDTIEALSLQVVEKWKLGRKDVDDGVLLLIAKESRELRIEVGYGLEGALSDVIASRIIRDFITPEFKKGNYAEGIDTGITQIINVIQGEPLPEPANPLDDLPEWQRSLLYAFLMALAISAVLEKAVRLVDIPNYAVSGTAAVIGFGAYFVIFGSVIYALACAVMAFVIPMITANGGMKSSSRDRGNSSRSSSRGGGGSFGGGGSSGSW
ncbi:TPM domain-containing protein [Oceanospirillum sanctuarii]|uniref:TPM domain-containing protein n=1 Tax=Oceanospirillum sanctuarii TaxID=1434821 RepID=UPI000A3CF9BF|nr:YgcG family protein [Oceanospirillum sanctuarii]